MDGVYLYLVKVCLCFVRFLFFSNFVKTYRMDTGDAFCGKACRGECSMTHDAIFDQT